METGEKPERVAEEREAEKESTVAMENGEKPEAKRSEFTPSGVALFRIERLQQELEDVQQADDDQLLLRCCLALMERMPEQLELDSEECTVAFDIDTFDEEAVYALEQLLLLNPAASS
uniref:NET domain-containing protein n=1 Tax=Globodera pallida TaxID=36090 RepID=A0A183BQQ2_GLOPA